MHFWSVEWVELIIAECGCAMLTLSNEMNELPWVHLLNVAAWWMIPAVNRLRGRELLITKPCPLPTTRSAKDNTDVDRLINSFVPITLAVDCHSGVKQNRLQFIHSVQFLRRTCLDCDNILQQYQRITLSALLQR